MIFQMRTPRWEDLKRRKHTPDKLRERDRKVARDLLEMELREMRETSRRAKSTSPS
jgi:hypothetical protein